MGASPRAGAVLRIAGWIIIPSLELIARRRWVDRDRLHQPGGAIICGNHAAPLDALLYGELLHRSGIPPRFLAKHTLFEVPVLGSLLRVTGQIPVLRGSARASDALAAARRVLRDGHTVIIFPEGTYTRDPSGWPMRGRRGAARLALQSGAPLVPVGCWGSAAALPVGARWPRLLPRRTITLRVGAPIMPAPLPGESIEQAEIRLTDELMDAITDLVRATRGGDPPAVRHDPRRDARRPESGR